MQAPIEHIHHGPAEDFTERLLELINGGSLVLMISIGHRTGLFDALADLGDVSSVELARAAGLNERYVREWLGAMVVGRIVEHDPKAGTYLLPDAHALSLCRKSAATNVAVYTQYLAVLGRVEDEIVECFRHGGGLPYESFPRFHEVMAEDSAQTVLPVLESTILPLVPGLVDRLRLGVEVLDLGCGRARALLLLAERFPRSRFVGVDISAETLDWAREQARERGLTNIDFVRSDAASLGAEHRGRYDLITTFDAIHDQRDPAAVLAMIAQSLAPGGVYLMQDIASSGRCFIASLAGGRRSLRSFLPSGCSAQSPALEGSGYPPGLSMSVSLAQGGAGLGAAWGRERAEAMLAEAGFGSVVVHQLEHDLQNDYYVCRRSADDIW